MQTHSLIEIKSQKTRVANCPSGISSLAERALWERNVRGSIPRSPIFYCAIAQLAEHPPVKRNVPGSNPGSTVLEMIRIGKGPTLKVGAVHAVAGSSPCHLRHAQVAQQVEQALDRGPAGGSSPSLCSGSVV